MKDKNIEKHKELFSNRLQSLIDKYDIKQNELAKRLGTSESTVGKWILRKHLPTMGIIQQLSDMFGVPKSYFIEEGEGSADAYKEIPVFEKVACGVPISCGDAPYETIKLADFEDADFGLIVKGDSMQPRIFTNDIVLVKSQEDVNNGELAIVLVDNEESTCKKVIKQENGILLISFNNNYQPMFYSNEQIKSIPIKILGRVVGLRAKL